MKLLDDHDPFIPLKSDGLNVKKTAFDFVSAKEKASYYPALLNISTCLHLVHRACQMGTKE